MATLWSDKEYEILFAQELTRFCEIIQLLKSNFWTFFFAGDQYSITNGFFLFPRKNTNVFADYILCRILVKLMMNEYSITLGGITCKSYENNGFKVIDLRPAGFFKDPIPLELFKNTNISKIILCHENVPSLLDSIIPVLHPNLAIEIFDQYESNSSTGQKIDIGDLFKICSAKVNHQGAISLDLSCKALKGKPFKLSSQKQLKQLIVRDYKDGIFNSDNTGEFYDLEELIISQGELETKKLVENAVYGLSPIERFPSMVLDGIVVEASYSKLNDLRLHRESRSFPFLGRMQNLHKIFISAGGNELSPTGLDKLFKLEEITIIDNPVGDDFKMLPTMKNLSKVVLFNCGLHQLPAGLEYCSKLQELVIHHSEIHGKDPLIIPKLLNLKNLDLSHCGLHHMPVLKECSDLQELILHRNELITSGEDSIFIPELDVCQMLLIFQD